jgi:hypothetical protein
MTTAEMNRRLATLTQSQIDAIRTMIRQGYGGHGIACEYDATVKQINAVFELHYREADADAWLAAKAQEKRLVREGR